ncbi:ribonuclease domain-containing protein [Pseudonocardia zijingensis]|uniref:Ribonuclease n=1 Tax=Pseudonocardia zijingensis TaxID=153376 RepID=A0ABN1PEY5_9PSEU
MTRFVIALLLAVVALAGCQSAPTSAPPVSGAEATTGSAATTSAAADDGIPDCPVAELPPEAPEVIEDIEAGGPYEYPRNDGVTFGNREGLLPDEDRGYYREFTVETPGSRDRGARRIVTGGPDERDPEHWYYTDDHYESFCEFVP